MKNRNTLKFMPKRTTAETAKKLTEWANQQITFLESIPDSEVSEAANSNIIGILSNMLKLKVQISHERSEEKN